MSVIERPRRPGPPTARFARGLAIVGVLAILAGCDTGPTAAPSVGASAVAPTLPPGVTPAPTVLPTPTAAADFPLAVVTGLTNHRANVTLDDLATLAADGKLEVPCGIAVMEPPITVLSQPPCVAADQVAAAIEKDQTLVALLPPGLVEPSTKVLPIAGDSPYGLFGPDLFGDPESRAMPYPVKGRITGDSTIDPAWTAYDATQVWTLNETGSLCADRSGAHQAVTLKKGWDWVFDGGTAKYKGPPIPNPKPPPGIDRHPIVRPIETGNAGLTSQLIRRADVTLGNHKCPILPTKDWRANDTGTALSFAVPEDVVSRWIDFLGIDALYLPADHQSDRGVRGIRSTLNIIDKNKIPHTGLGMNLDEALAPAFVEVAGVKVAFVAWNDVPAPAHASATTPGVAWLTKANVDAAVKRARAEGADLVICDPQWWGGGSEYKPYLRPVQVKQIGWMDAAGCDQIFAGGLHVAGGLFFREGKNGLSVVNAGPGNFQFGQEFWQNTQEGVVLQATFQGTKLVNIRLHPYVMILAARAALLDPVGDGHYVLDRIFDNSELDPTP
ncbi:MAG: CapA family protein [Chloroflexota bacterium]